MGGPVNSNLVKYLKGLAGGVSPSAIASAVSDYLSTHPVSAAWSTITGKPSSFTPAAHNHDSLYQPLETGKGLSSNDYTTAEKSKLAGVTNYVHPDNHPASIITQDANNRFVTDTEKTTWNGKQNSEAGKGLSTNDLSNTRVENYDIAYNHSQSIPHAPANAQKNSDITKAEIEAKLTGVIGTHSHAGSPLYARVTGSDATTTGQSLTTITGLSLSLEANSVYEIYACLIVGVTAVTTGQQFGVNLSNTSGATISAGAFGTLAAATAQGKRISAFNSATAAFNTAPAGTGIVIISGVVTTGSVAPTLTIQHLKVTSGTSTVYIGSFVSAIKI